jgi:hypothetical protein
MFAISHLYNSACSSSSRYIRIQPIFMSIIFHHYKEISKLCEELQKEKEKEEEEEEEEQKS